MLQFFFLSVLLNLITGFILVNSEKKYVELPFIENKTFELVLGILCVATGIMKLFVVVNTKVAIFGDFVPAVAGIAGGFALLIQYINQNFPEWIQRIFVANKYFVGIVCMAVALIHFVVPGAMFL